MKQLHSSRHLVKMWHRREKSMIDHLVRSLGEAKVASANTHSAFTPTGLAVEEQVRKAWQPCAAGLAMF